LIKINNFKKKFGKNSTEKKIKNQKFFSRTANALQLRKSDKRKIRSTHGVDGT
jgi:hypothetical protein